MTIGRSLCRVAIYGGICFGASVLLPELAIPVAFLSTEKGQDILTKVGEMISGVTAGNTANAIDNFDRSRGSDYVRLENEDLIRVCGKAIAQIIHLAAQNSNNPYSKHLKMIAAKATENWVELARSEFDQSKYQQLTEGEIPLILTPTEEGLTQAEILTVEEWRTILAKLDLMAVDSAEGVDLPDYVRQYVAELLYKEFPRVLREALKQDFKADGKAFAGLMLQLITGIRQQVAELGELAPICLAKLNEIEKHLKVSEQQQERISAKIDEQSQKLDQIINVLQPHPGETTEEKLLKALLNLDYDKQANLFKEFVENHQIGACLVHGSCESAPRWLLNRLIRYVPNGKTFTNPNTSNRSHSVNCVKKIKFSRRNYTSSLDTVFEEISRKFQMEITSSVTAIHQKILEVWQSETVILIIQNTQNVEESYIEEFLQKFWQPLAQLARERGTTNENYSLLLFLLDEDGDSNDWNIVYTQDPTSDLIPHALIKLIDIQPITRRQLSIWLELCCGAEKLLEYTDSLVDEIFRDSQNGLHQHILETICSLCQTSWDECESKWMKY
ncbi:MAG: hypothetical protein P5680_16225 [Limnospira sp. PMC 737.11]|uniref:hypothetical protein n=1 Tax=Limnospira sp. PMC 737.11 TaxID=2981095 RepID=UPI0028E0CB0B|nr:hypothetical protein [Limnospira sp. PMC 737.11]MDT9276139.1 hypothetical protein [Limnospira sp. PMC 737.11]